MPAWPVIIVLRAVEVLGLSPLYQWVYETVAKDSFVSIDKAREKLGWVPKIKFAELVAEMMESDLKAIEQEQWRNDRTAR